jgi:hypothetical protein
MADEMAPNPFTPDEIRAGCPSGRTVRWRVEEPDGEAYLRVSRFLDADDEGATLERSRQTLGGEPVGEVQSARQTWTEFQANSSFPSAVTTIDSETIDTELGRLDCLRYTVRDGDEENSFWFATELPGPPVRYETTVAGQVVASGSVV